jgi:hypothetical protein
MPPQPFGNLFQTLQQGGMPKPKAFPANQYGPTLRSNLIAKGSLVTFNYMFFKHDQNPLVIVTDIWRDYIRGVNLHYLTFPYVKRLLQGYCDNVGFGYANIRGDDYIVSAFRQYKRNGIRQIRKLDCAFLLNVLASVRTFDPAEVDAIRNSVREQIRKVTNPVAQATPEQPIQQTPQTLGQIKDNTL